MSNVAVHDVFAYFSGRQPLHRALLAAPLALLLCIFLGIMLFQFVPALRETRSWFPIKLLITFTLLVGYSGLFAVWTCGLSCTNPTLKFWSNLYLVIAFVVLFFVGWFFGGWGLVGI